MIRTNFIVERSSEQIYPKTVPSFVFIKDIPRVQRAPRSTS